MVCLHQVLLYKVLSPTQPWQQLSAPATCQQLEQRYAATCKCPSLSLPDVAFNSGTQAATLKPSQPNLHNHVPIMHLPILCPHRRQTAAATEPACRRFTAVAGKHARCRRQWQIPTPPRHHHQKAHLARTASTYTGEQTQHVLAPAYSQQLASTDTKHGHCKSSFGHMPLLDWLPLCMPQPTSTNNNIRAEQVHTTSPRRCSVAQGLHTGCIVHPPDCLPQEVCHREDGQLWEDILRLDRDGVGDNDLAEDATAEPLNGWGAEHGMARASINLQHQAHQQQPLSVAKAVTMIIITLGATISGTAQHPPASEQQLDKNINIGYVF